MTSQANNNVMSTEEAALAKLSKHVVLQSPSLSAASMAQAGPSYSVRQWRLKEKLKTVQGCLALCLNIGVDPPDVNKVQPCAKLQCWVDPQSAANGPANTGTKALEIIGNNLKAQYERWQPRARHTLCLDPTVDDIKKTLVQLRKVAKNDRILFHYNGHGVPRPTASGELWVFNKTFTQYIPLSIWDVFTWLGEPSLIVLDCSSAASICIALANMRTQKNVPIRDTLILAACGPGELLPMNPRLPADVFSSCLTTPIKVALKLYAEGSPLLRHLDDDMLEKIPGKIIDRKTPIGELNWIFTAITDTIAWNILPRSVFQRLFRQDLLVAALFRNFLYADRVMRQYNCTPVSFPRLPPTHMHPLWQSWDLALDMCLSQLPLPSANDYINSTFFADQLTAFEVWLDYAYQTRHAHLTTNVPPKGSQPEQLPIVLQVLLSQTHRLRALRLLARFLDLGPWAVNLSLSVGIFPYVLKLLQSPAPELRDVLVDIWTRILALDESCQADLTKDGGWNYFVSLLATKGISAELKAKACFILCRILSTRMAKELCFSAHLLMHLLHFFQEPDITQSARLRKWLCLCIARFMDHFEEGRQLAFREGLDEYLMLLFRDDDPTVRAAAVYCAGVLVRSPGSSLVDSDGTNTNVRVGWLVLPALDDGSATVRRECAVVCGILTANAADHVRAIVGQAVKEEKARREQQQGQTTLAQHAVREDVSDASNNSAAEDFYRALWLRLQFLSIDPVPLVSQAAGAIIDFVVLGLAHQQQQLQQQQQALMDPPMSPVPHQVGSPAQPNAFASSVNATPTSPVLKGKKKGSVSHMMAAPEPQPELPRVPQVSDLPKSTFYERSLADFGWVVPEDENAGVSSSSHTNDEAFRSFVAQRILHAQSLARADLFDDKRKLDDPVAMLDNMSEGISCMRFHSYAPYLVMSDEGSHVTVWMWEKAHRLQRFNNGNMGTSRITALDWLNEHHAGNVLLATGSDDGHVRVWSGIGLPGDGGPIGEPALVAGFAAASELTARSQGPGMLMTWQQHHALLTVGGPSPLLRSWDMERQRCVHTLQTGTPGTVTSLTSDQDGGCLLIAGCDDGSVRMFDTRLPSEHAIVASWSEHRGGVVNVHKQLTGSNVIISGSVAGDIKFWDARRTESVRTIDAHRTGMTSLAVHNYAPVMASGSNNQFIKVYDIQGGVLNMIYYHDGFLDHWMGPLSYLMFHPSSLFLAAAAIDATVSIYGRR
jgi:regulator-associated protein of mTOR